MSGDTEVSVRAVWRTLDAGMRREVDDAVARGVAAPHAALGTVGLWRALRLRRQWAGALVLTPLAVAAAALAVVLGAGSDAGAVLRAALSPATMVSILAAVSIPVRRLYVLRRAIHANCDLALSGPQLTDRSSRAASELSRHLALRAAQARVQSGDSEA